MMTKSKLLLLKIEESGATAHLIIAKTKQKLNRVYADLAQLDKNVLLLSSDDKSIKVKTSYSSVCDLALQHDCEVQAMGE